jgi:trimethylamine--corrinoid protein Co-methyltransferase
MPHFAILPTERMEQIVAEAFETLERIGVLVENHNAIELLAGAGAKVADDRKRVFVSRDLAEQCIASVPSSFALYDRDGAEVGLVGGDNVIFNPGSAAISIHDFAGKRIRQPHTKDVIEFVRLADRLDAFDAQSTAVVPADIPEDLGDRYRLFLALIYGKKPIITGTFVKDAFAVMRSLLTTVRGNKQTLRDKPLAIFDCCPSPPLMWSDLTAQALIDCAEHGIPAQIVSMPLAGATGPVTMAGSLVQHTAETLSGIVIHQTVCPGAALVYGGATACFDMRVGAAPMGAIETMMAQAAHVQIARSFGVPAHVYMGLSDAKSPDFQAGSETAMGVTLAALAGANIVSGPGMLNFLGTQSLEKLVLDNEICAAAKRLIKGIRFREKSAGFEVLNELAESKSFLSSEHTRRLFRDEVYYPSNVVDRSPQGDWEKAGSSTAADRAHQKATELLQDKSKDSFPPKGIISDLESIILADARKHGAKRLPNWWTLAP